jgi:multidrug efflux pump subunit AcrB
VTLTFKLATDLNTAESLTQSRVLIAQPRLPEPVQQLGLTVKKVSSDYLIVPHLFSTWLTPDLHRTHGRPPVQEYRLWLKRP